jgi:hypothetical protein
VINPSRLISLARKTVDFSSNARLLALKIMKRSGEITKRVHISKIKNKIEFILLLILVYSGGGVGGFCAV